MSDTDGTLLPIELGVTRVSINDLARSEPEPDEDSLRELHRQVFERDHFSCQFCGFTSRKYQEVRAINGNPRDLRLDNLATSCQFCAQCFELEKVAERKSGTLIWLPEVPQAALNHIARAVYIARITSGPMADAGRIALEALMSRREGARERLGSDDPEVLASVLQDFLEDFEYSDRVRKLDGIRLLPHDRRIIKEGDMEFNQFPQILAYWRSKDGPFGGLMPGTWLELFDDVTEQVSTRMGTAQPV